jgi:hypothetical protein
MKNLGFKSLVIGLVLCVGQTGQAGLYGSSGDKPTAAMPPASSSQVHQDSQVQQTGWPSLPLPKISMPKVSMPDMSPITRPVKSGYGKIASGTKHAWDGTKEMFSFGKGNNQPAGQTSQSQEKPGFWSRIFSKEPEEPKGPQTVAEWMSLPRVE